MASPDDGVGSRLTINELCNASSGSIAIKTQNDDKYSVLFSCDMEVFSLNQIYQGLIE